MDAQAALAMGQSGKGRRAFARRKTQSNNCMHSPIL